MKEGFRIYIVSAPFEMANSGDTDYGNALVAAMNQGRSGNEHVAEYVTGSTKLNGQDLYSTRIDAISRFGKSYSENPDQYKNLKDELKNNDKRKEAVDNIREYIKVDSEKDKVIPILSLQLRPTDSGALFVPEDFKDYKEKIPDIKISVTCHEYKLNSTRRNLQAYAQHYFREADNVVFFNEKDRDNAIEHASRRAFSIDQDDQYSDRGHIKISQEDHRVFTHEKYELGDKTFLSAVPPTVRYDERSHNFDEFRPANIIAFGMIRNEKGFEAALEIAKTLYNMQKQNENNNDFALKNSKVIIAGNPADNGLMFRILSTKYKEGKSILEKNFRKINGIDKTEKFNKLINQLEEKHKDNTNVLPIDIILNIPAEQMPALFKEAKYAVKYDNKGWANNASGHISALANGCVLYTGHGMDTPDDVLPAYTKIPREKSKKTEQYDRLEDHNIVYHSDGKYAGAIVFLSGKYSLKEQEHLTEEQEKGEGLFKGIRGKSIHFEISGTNAPANKRMITADMVLNDIIERENNPELNRATLIQAKKLFEEKFRPDVVAKAILENYQRLIDITTEREQNKDQSQDKTSQLNQTDKAKNSLHSVSVDYTKEEEIYTGGKEELTEEDRISKTTSEVQISQKQSTKEKALYIPKQRQNNTSNASAKTEISQDINRSTKIQTKPAVKGFNSRESKSEERQTEKGQRRQMLTAAKNSNIEIGQAVTPDNTKSEQGQQKKQNRKR